MATPPERSAADTVLGWLDRADPRRGIHVATADGWESVSYAALAAAVARVARGLRSAGVPRAGTVCLVQRPGTAFVTAFFATLLHGAAASPVAPPMPFQDATVYRRRLDGVLARAGPALLIVDEDAGRGLRAAAGTVAPVATVASLSTTTAAPSTAPLGPTDVALVQFTSGTSGLARGVRIPLRALAANITAIRRWLEWTPDDPVASWLPVHHDMGLIGTLLTSVTTGSDLWLLRPGQFVADPVRYLACFGRSGARLSAMPTFGLAHVVRRVRPPALAGMDFSGWRALVVGAEPVQAAVLDAFAALLAPFGFRDVALSPAYGMAEATLAVTGVPPGRRWSAVRRRPGGAGDGRDDDARPVVGCGLPLPGVHVSVVDSDGTPLPPGHLGEIVVRAPSVGAGYVGADTGSTRFVGDVLRTGDAGFLREGQLFVVGRTGDSVKVRGQTIFAEDLEAVLLAHGFQSRRTAVALGVHDGRTTVLVALESGATTADHARALLRPHIDDARLRLVEVPVGTIPRTSSGKVRRHALWRTALSCGAGGAAQG